MKCCKNECNEQSTWSLGNAISACDLHKKDLQLQLSGWHIHSKCGDCGYKFHVDKLCEIKNAHSFKCIVCL